MREAAPPHDPFQPRRRCRQPTAVAGVDLGAPSLPYAPHDVTLMSRNGSPHTDPRDPIPDLLPGPDLAAGDLGEQDDDGRFHDHVSSSSPRTLRSGVVLPESAEYVT